MPATPTQNTVTSTHTTVAGGVETHTTMTAVVTEQVASMSFSESHSSSASASYSESHSSSSSRNGVVTSSEHSESSGSFGYEAHGSSSASGSISGSAIAYGSESSTTIVDGVAHGHTTVVGGVTTVIDGHATTTTCIGGSSTPAAPATPATPAIPATPATPAIPATPATPAIPAAPATPAEHVQKKIRDGRLGAHGVNLGSWLVAEQWMSSSSEIWRDAPEGIQGEYQVLTHGNNREQRLANFDKHHATYITEADIEAIAKAGFNMVRVPVGWWILDADHDDPGNKSEMEAFPKHTALYVDKLVREWAVRHNIAVLVDIHAAKGSQNGDQHSAPTTTGVAYWGKYPENVRNTVLLAKFIGERYKNDDAFLGIGLLNEPAADTDEKVLAQYHLDAYQAVRESGNDCILSCMPYRYRQEPDNLVGFMEAPTHKNVWIEWHPYFIWGNENKSGDELINKTVATEFQDKVNKWNNRPNANKLFISEWSLANVGQFRDPDSPDFAAWARAQVKVMNQAKAGWAYWNWKIDGDEKNFEAWSARSVISREPLRKILLEATEEPTPA